MKRIAILCLFFFMFCELNAQTFPTLKSLSDYVTDSIKRRPDKITAQTLNKAYQGTINFMSDIVNDTASVLSPHHGYIRFQQKDSTAYIYDTSGVRRWRKYVPANIGAYADEQAQDAVGAMLSSEFIYNDAAPQLSINSINAGKINGNKTSAFISDFATAVLALGDAKYSLLNHQHTTSDIANFSNGVHALFNKGYGLNYNQTTGNFSADTLSGLVTNFKLKTSLDSTKNTVQTFYNADGTLTGDRTIYGFLKNLSYYGINGYSVASNNTMVFSNTLNSHNSQLNLSDYSQIFSNVSGHQSALRIYSDSLALDADSGKLIISQLRSTADTAYKIVVRDPVTRAVKYYPYWPAFNNRDSSYTDEKAQDAIAAALSSEFTYNDAANTIGLNSIAWSKVTGAPNFLTSETDPLFNAHVAHSITSTNISNWNSAFSWGNHAGLYPLLTGSYTNPTWISSLAWSKITGAPSMPSASGTTGAVQLSNGSGGFTSDILNYSSGALNVNGGDVKVSNNLSSTQQGTHWFTSDRLSSQVIDPTGDVGSQLYLGSSFLRWIYGKSDFNYTSGTQYNWMKMDNTGIQFNSGSTYGGLISLVAPKVVLNGQVGLTSVPHATANSDSIMTMHNGIVKYRTASELGISALTVASSFKYPYSITYLSADSSLRLKGDTNSVSGFAVYGINGTTKQYYPGLRADTLNITDGEAFIWNKAAGMLGHAKIPTLDTVGIKNHGSFMWSTTQSRLVARIITQSVQDYSKKQLLTDTSNGDQYWQNILQPDNLLVAINDSTIEFGGGTTHKTDVTTTVVNPLEFISNSDNTGRGGTNIIANAGFGAVLGFYNSFFTNGKDWGIGYGGPSSGIGLGSWGIRNISKSNNPFFIDSSGFWHNPVVFNGSQNRMILIDSIGRIIPKNNGTNGQVWTRMPWGPDWADAPTSSGTSGITGMTYYNNGTQVNSTPRPAVNFIPGTNITYSIADNSANNRIDVTINSAGGTGGGVSASSPNTWTAVQTFANTVTAASGRGEAFVLNPFLYASANNDTLAAVTINPIFNLGAFTNISANAIKVNGNIIPMTSSAYSLGNSVRQWSKVYSGTYQSIASLTLNSGTSGSGILAQLAGVTVGEFMPTTGNLILQNGGTFTDVATSRFTVASTTQGSIPAPKMTNAQMTAISSPVEGLQVFDGTNHVPSFYNGSSWLGLVSGTGSATALPVWSSATGLTNSNITEYAGTGGAAFHKFSINLGAGSTPNSAFQVEAIGGDYYSGTRTGTTYFKVANDGSITSLGSVSAVHLLGNSSTPTVTLGSSVTGSVSISGNDMGGVITVTVSSPSSLATLGEFATVTFNSAYSSTPYVTITPASSSAAGNVSAAYVKNSSTTGFSIATANSGTFAATTYVWTYHVTN